MSERDEKAPTFGAADYKDYVANMLVQGGSVAGLKAGAKHPLHPLFLDRLEAGSAEAQALMAPPTPTPTRTPSTSPAKRSTTSCSSRSMSGSRRRCSAGRP